MSSRRCAGLVALLFTAAASVSPAVAVAGAGDECGTVGVPPAGNVVVASGSIVCADAMAVVNHYLGEFALAPADSEWIRFDGWDCWTPSAAQAMVNGFGTECSRGGDNVQIRD